MEVLWIDPVISVHDFGRLSAQMSGAMSSWSLVHLCSFLLSHRLEKNGWGLKTLMKEDQELLVGDCETENRM